MPKVEFVLQPKLEQAIEYIRTLRRAGRRIAFDIETVGRYVRCLGISGKRGGAICIPFTCSPISRGISGSGTTIPAEVFGGTSSPDLYNYWSEHEELQLIRELDTLFRDPNVEKVAQNAPFDLSILADNFGLHVSNFVQDTMLAQHNCYIELPKGLDFLASIYTNYQYWSDYEPGSDLSTWTYNCYDSTITLEVSEVLDREMAELNVGEFYRHQYHDQIFAITRAETRGIAVDLAEKERRRVKVDAEVKTMVGKLQAIVTRTFDAKRGKNIVQVPFNPNSPVHMKEYLYATLRLPQQFKRTPNGPTVTTDKNAIVALSRSYPEHSALFDLLLAYSKAETLLGFLNRRVGDDGRIRTHYNLGGTESRRLASSEPLFDPGTNLQNIPRGDFRSMFVADPGWSLIKADLSQAEFRLVVWMARIDRIIALYTEHGSQFDVHKWNAANNIFLVAIEQVTKEMRTLAKNGVYGGNYAMWWKKAAIVYNMPEPMAKLILNRYHQNVPEVSQTYWPETQAMINGTGIITNILGSKRIFFGRRDDDTYRKAYAYRASETVSGIVNRAFALADEIMDEKECHPLLQVHDEIVFHCRDDKIGVYTPIVRRLLEYPIKFPGVTQPLTIPAEVQVGKDWFNQKEMT